MNRWEQNISRWYALGLAAILLTVSLVLATGTAWARYRTEYEETIKIKTQKPAGIYLGQTDAETGVFDSAAVGTWEENESVVQLVFTVANGADDQNYQDQTQIFRVRLIGDLGMCLESAPPAIKLIDPRVYDLAEAAQEDVGYLAEPVRISRSSLLYTTFGDGWVYRFLDQDGEEITWTLDGKTFSSMELIAVMVPDEDTQIDTGLLQLQILAETSD